MAMVMDPFDPDTLGTDAHLDALDGLRPRGDVVELAVALPAARTSARRTFVALSHAAVGEAARHPLLSSSWGTGSTDVPEAREDGVPFRAVHMSTGAVHAELRDKLAHVVAVDEALVLRVRAAVRIAVSRAMTQDGALDALAFAMQVQRAALGPRFGVDDATLDQNLALVHRAAFAVHDEPTRANAVTRDVDAALVAGRHDDDAWLMRFAWLTAFVTTELALVHMLEALATRGWGELRRSDAATRARFVDECLRVQSPVARFGRVAIDDVTIAGVTIPRGARVLLSFAAANHDPRVYDAPRMLNLLRARPRHFAFGAGEHACVGAPVALAILRAALDAMLDDAGIGHADVVEHVPLRSHVNRGARASRLMLDRDGRA